MKKCFIFAHYDKNNIIKQYIIDEINFLNELGDVLFISDCEFLSNIDSLPEVKYLQVSRHSLYDVHSYKCGFEYLKNTQALNTYDNITFVNSSIIFPTCDKEIFIKELNKFDNLSPKVYGMCKSSYLLQSYWITCKKDTYTYIDNFFKMYIPATVENVKKWYNSNVDKKLIDKYQRWYNSRIKEVGEELTLKWIYTVVHFEEGFSHYLHNKKFKLIALDYGCWPKSRFITKYPRE